MGLGGFVGFVVAEVCAGAGEGEDCCGFGVLVFGGGFFGCCRRPVGCFGGGEEVVETEGCLGEVGA